MYGLETRARQTDKIDLNSRPARILFIFALLAIISESSLSYSLIKFSSNSETESLDSSESFFLPFLFGLTARAFFPLPVPILYFALIVEYTSFVSAFKNMSHRFCENRTKLLKNRERTERTNEFYRLYFLSNSWIIRLTSITSTTSWETSSQIFVLKSILQTHSIVTWRRIGSLTCKYSDAIKLKRSPVYSSHTPCTISPSTADFKATILFFNWLRDYAAGQGLSSNIEMKVLEKLIKTSFSRIVKRPMHSIASSVSS